MRKFDKGHKQVKCYADGGEVKKEWPEPSYMEAVKDRVKSLVGGAAKPAAVDKVEGAVARRRRMLDET